MKTSRFGCLSATGIITALVTLLLISGFSIARGGVLFNPGQLNDQKGAEPLQGVYSHAEITEDCGACHTAFWTGEHMAERCLACHDKLTTNPQDFHNIMLAQSGGLNCARCHTDHRGAEAALTLLDMKKFPHMDAVHFALSSHQKHSDGATFLCEDCHGADLAEFQRSTCVECHTELDPAYLQAHQADFGEDCLACHDGVETYGAAFDHNRLQFTLTQAHAEARCQDCHAGALRLADLQAAPQTCAACHLEDDAHTSQLGQDCAQCHASTTWEEATFDHSRAAFALTGKHAQVACEDCHKDKIFKGAPQDCYSCHAQQDEHNGQFGQDCAACHTTDGWEGATFDHSLSSFPLTGAHANVSCEDCHREGVYTGTAQECVACHLENDEHNGRFGQDCAQCHTTDTWEGAQFDHSLAAFKLTGAHVNVPCEQCHMNDVFKGAPQACTSCHAEPLYHQGLFSTDCGACHNTNAWLPATYNERHRFPTNHGGQGNSCQTCHPSSLLSYTCYGCHEHNQAKVESEHREEGIGDFRDCVRCHPTGREEEGGDD